MKLRFNAYHHNILLFINVCLVPCTLAMEDKTVITYYVQKLFETTKVQVQPMVLK